ncbi:MAG: ABC transporter ATP-binding protein, partial [Kiritimatiellae bacterium]|nr:ABC transporter ATP-binding protein [Kiritimatiellia bacterium]
MSETSPQPSTKPPRPGVRESIACFGYFVRRYPRRTLVTIACLVLSGAAEGMSITLFVPLLHQITGANASAGRVGEWLFTFFAEVGFELTLQRMLICIVVGLTLKGVLFWAAMNQVGFTVARVATDLRLELMRALTQARWSYFVGQPVGQFANAIASESLKASVSYQSASYVIACGIQLSVYTALAFILSWQTALVGALTGLVFLAMMYRMIAITRVAGKRQVALMKSVTGRIVDMLSGLKPVKAMARETSMLQYLEAEAESLNVAQRTEVRATATVAAAQEPVMTAVMAAGLYVVLTYDLMPLPALLVLAFLFSRLFNQVNQVIQHYQRMVSYESAFSSIQERLQEVYSQVESQTGAAAPDRLTKAIRLKDVDFAYGETRVLENLNIEIPARQWTSLVGPSGAGKTTLLDLVAGLHAPTKGDVLIDDASLQGISLKSWRSQLGYVPQEMLLLHESVFANITLGEEGITRDDVEQALRATDAWDFVSALPDGMDTPVGERGTR